MTATPGDRKNKRPRGMHYVIEPSERDREAADKLASQARFPTRKHLTLEVPLPYKALSKNWPKPQSAGARAAVSDCVREYRGMVAVLARLAMVEQGWGEPAAATIDLVYGTLLAAGTRDAEHVGREAYWPYRPRDSWNGVTAFHPGFDGLTDAGVWPDDSFRWATLGSCHIDPAVGPAIYIYLTERAYG